jgi:hypothetical protein
VNFDNFWLSQGVSNPINFYVSPFTAVTSGGIYAFLC